MEGLVRSSANYVPLSPIGFLERSGLVYWDQTSLVYGTTRFTWGQTLQRCTKLASALARLSISYGDVVAALLPNIPAMYELHFGVPMSGGILCTLNTRHDSTMVSVLLKHSEAKILFVDHHLYPTAQEALQLLSKRNSRLPQIILVSDPQSPVVGTTSMAAGELEYENFLETGSLDFEIRRPRDELDPISLNYTSGTTSSPKGVVYSHRGAYLNSLAAVLLNEMRSMPVYLWTVPMFHCNGWCMTWGVAAQGGANVCLRNVTAKAIFDSVAEYGVTHMGGAPTVLNMIINAPSSDRKPPRDGERVVVMTGAAPPPPHVLSEMEALGFVIVHAYGLTETYGPGTVCVWKPEWDPLPAEAQAKLKARQGVPHIAMDRVEVMDPTTMTSVPSDGRTIGEVMFRGNTVMTGYLKDHTATQQAFEGGWFHTGDLGVRHPDGYIELKDRSKDIVISGGENVSTIEVESVLFGHPGILEAAVVGRPDHHWGETVCAFVKLKQGWEHVGPEEIIKVL